MDDTLTYVGQFYPGMLVRMKSDNRLLRVTSPKQKWIHGEFEDGTGWRFQPQHARPADPGDEFVSRLGDDLVCHLGDSVRFKLGTTLRYREGNKVFVVMGFTAEGVKLTELNGHTNQYYRSVTRNKLERAEVQPV